VTRLLIFFFSEKKNNDSSSQLTILFHCAAVGAAPTKQQKPNTPHTMQALGLNVSELAGGRRVHRVRVCNGNGTSGQGGVFVASAALVGRALPCCVAACCVPS
jgi:hypothetical protein